MDYIDIEVWSIIDMLNMLDEIGEELQPNIGKELPPQSTGMRYVKGIQETFRDMLLDNNLCPYCGRELQIKEDKENNSFYTRCNNCQIDI